MTSESKLGLHCNSAEVSPLVSVLLPRPRSTLRGAPVRNRLRAATWLAMVRLAMAIWANGYSVSNSVITIFS